MKWKWQGSGAGSLWPSGRSAYSYSAGGFSCQTRWLKTGRTGIRSRNPTASILFPPGLLHCQHQNNVPGLTVLQGTEGAHRQCPGLFHSTLWLSLFTAYALVERHPKFLAFIHKAFVDLEVGVIFCHRILVEIALPLLVKPPADLP